MAGTDFVADAAFKVGIVARVVVLRWNNEFFSLMSAKGNRVTHDLVRLGLGDLLDRGHFRLIESLDL